MGLGIEILTLAEEHILRARKAAELGKELADGAITAVVGIRRHLGGDSRCWRSDGYQRGEVGSDAFHFSHTAVVAVIFVMSPKPIH